MALELIYGVLLDKEFNNLVNEKLINTLDTYELTSIDNRKTDSNSFFIGIKMNSSENQVSANSFKMRESMIKYEDRLLQNFELVNLLINQLNIDREKFREIFWRPQIFAVLI